MPGAGSALSMSGGCGDMERHRGRAPRGHSAVGSGCSSAAAAIRPGGLRYAADVMVHQWAKRHIVVYVSKLTKSRRAVSVPCPPCSAKTGFERSFSPPIAADTHARLGRSLGPVLPPRYGPPARRRGGQKTRSRRWGWRDRSLPLRKECVVCSGLLAAGPAAGPPATGRAMITLTRRRDGGSDRAAAANFARCDSGL